MRLSEKAISEFKRIYAEKFGVDLSKEQANSYGIELLQLFKLVYRSIPSSKLLSGVRNAISEETR